MTITAPWRKVIRDVWHQRTRALLVVAAMTIGLAEFLAVLSTYAILRRELNRGYVATTPASAVIVTDAIDESLLTAVAGRAGIADADARRVVSGRIETPDGSWRRLLLFAIRDFRRLRISTISPEGGAWPPQAGDLLIERDAFQVAQVQLGDTVMVETKNGGVHSLRVAGKVHDVGQAQARMENMVYGYISVGTLGTLGESARLDRLYLLTTDRGDQDRIRATAGDVKAWLENAGHVVSRVDIPKPGQHPHAVIMGLLLLLMAAFGLFALALSGVIVLNLVLAILAGERRQIGVMKAVGGTRAQIAQVYLAEAATFGLAALALALPIGVQGGRALSRYFAGLLNFDLNSLAAPWWLFVAAAIVALVVPIGAAAYPVAIATDITVREALSATGLAVTTFGAGRFDRLLCKIDTGGRPLLLGVRNSLRRRTRTALTLITLAIAGAFFISALSVRTSLMATVDRRFGASTYGADFRYAFDQHMLMIYVFLLVVSAVLASVAGLGLMTATSLNVLERRRELGVLRTIGATPPMVASIVILEAVFVATVAWALAVLSAWGIARGVNALVPAVTLFKDGVDFSLSAVGVAGWLLISVAIALVSSAVSAVAGARGSIREAIGYE